MRLQEGRLIIDSCGGNATKARTDEPLAPPFAPAPAPWGGGLRPRQAVSPRPPRPPPSQPLSALLLRGRQLSTWGIVTDVGGPSVEAATAADESADLPRCFSHEPGATTGAAPGPAPKGQAPASPPLPAAAAAAAPAGLEGESAAKAAAAAGRASQLTAGFSSDPRDEVVSHPLKDAKWGDDAE